jgi:hypothetical protein
VKRSLGASAAEVNEVMRFSRIDRVWVFPAKTHYEARTENVNTLPENYAFVVSFNTRTIKNRKDVKENSIAFWLTLS